LLEDKISDIIDFLLGYIYATKLRKSFVFAKRMEEKVVECCFLPQKFFYTLFTVTVTFRTYITDV